MIKSTSYTLKKWVFGTTAFIAIFTSETALISGTSKFLSQGLINWLPALLVLVSIGAIVNFGFNLLLSRKLSVSKSLVVSFLLMMMLIAACFYVQDNVAIYLFLSLLVVRLGMVIFDTSITNLAGAYVNSRQAKAFLPFIRGIFDVAILTGSAIIYFFSSLLIDPLWLVIGGLALLVIALMVINKLFDPIGQDDSVQTLSFKEGLKQSMNFAFKQSRLFHNLAWLFFLFGGIAVLFVYVYNQAFASNLSGEDLTRYIALVNFVGVALRGVFDFFLLRRAIYKLGVANLLLIYPWAMFLLSLLICIWSGSLLIATALYAFHVIAYFSFVNVVTQAMFGLTPRAVNQQVYFLIKGVMPSVAALLTSLVMTLALWLTNNNILIVTFMLLLFVAGTLALALRIKKQYQGALNLALVGDDIALKGNAVELMGERVQMENGEKMLRKIVLNEQETTELRQKALLSLVEIGNPNSIREFLLILEKDKNVRLRYYAVQAINRVFEKVGKKELDNMNVTRLLMVDVFNKVYEENLPLPVKLEVNEVLKLFGFNVLLDFYKQHFVSSSDFVKASIIEALSVANDRGLITLLEPYLDHPDRGIRSAAIAGLWRFEEMRDPLMNRMIEIFSEKDKASRLAALKLISQLKIKKMDDYVLDLVAVADAEISTMAVITSINLGKAGGLKVLVRKLLRAAMLGHQDSINFIFKKFYLLPPKMKKKFLMEIRSLSSANFDHLKNFFLKSDEYYDLELANLFSS